MLTRSLVCATPMRSSLAAAHAQDPALEAVGFGGFGDDAAGRRGLELPALRQRLLHALLDDPLLLAGPNSHEVAAEGRPHAEEVVGSHRLAFIAELEVLHYLVELLLTLLHHALLVL